MSLWYLDTSAALKLVVEEAESETLTQRLDQEHPDLVACWLLETELRRAAHRKQDLSQQLLTESLDGFGLSQVPT